MNGPSFDSFVTLRAMYIALRLMLSSCPHVYRHLKREGAGERLDGGGKAHWNGTLWLIAA